MLPRDTKREKKKLFRDERTEVNSTLIQELSVQDQFYSHFHTGQCGFNSLLAIMKKDITKGKIENKTLN